jgi:N-acetylmuramoyl-L-alanine amidase
MRRLSLILFIFLCLCLGVRPAMALSVRGLEFAQDGQQETVRVYLSAKAAYKLHLITKPPRIAIDIPTATFPGLKRALRNYRGQLISGVRFGSNSKTVSRLVFDLNQRPRAFSSQLKSRKGKIYIEVLLNDKDRKTAHAKPRVVVKVEKPMIVIDAGHGGQDPGAIGARGTQEKDITLAVAKKLRDALLATHRYRVALTRDDDRFILLRERVQIARRLHAQLFVSLHINSAPEKTVDGASVYTLSDKASDQEAEALAARENKADLIAGMDLNGASEDVAGILIDLAQRETNHKSAQLSRSLVISLAHGAQMLPNSQRSAGFAVLKAPDIPSVLVELGFITNAHEEKLLKTRAYQKRLAHVLADGIDKYFKARSVI